MDIRLVGTVRLLRPLVLSLFCAIAWITPASSAQITRYFPDNAAARPETGWRITYDVLKRGVHGYGPAEVLEIQSVEFMRGYNERGEKDWIRVLRNLALTEMYVLYNDGAEFFDISGNTSVFSKSPAIDLPSDGVLWREVRPDGVVAEVVDEQARWVSVPSNVRRGRTLDLWAVMEAGEYRYILRYSFTDSGAIRVRVGATGRNARNMQVGNNSAVHVHMPAWRFEFDLGTLFGNTIQVAERLPAAPATGLAAVLNHRPFNGGSEGGEVWDADRFTTLMITSQTKNKHAPSHQVSYKLVSSRTGSLHTAQPFTKSDYWVTRLSPATRPVNAELQFIEVDQYVRDHESIDNQATAIWHSVPFQHVPGTEDFGPRDYNTSEGLTLTMWSGFDLLPHNLWDKTPLFQP